MIRNHMSAVTVCIHCPFIISGYEVIDEMKTTGDDMLVLPLLCGALLYIYVHKILPDNLQSKMYCCSTPYCFSSG